MAVYGKAGTEEQIIDNTNHPQCPDGYIPMQSPRPADGNYLAQDDGSWKKYDVVKEALTVRNSQSRTDRELINLHKSNPDSAFEKLLKNVIRNQEDF